MLLTRERSSCTPEVAHLTVFKKSADLIYRLYLDYGTFLKTTHMKNTTAQIEFIILDMLIYKQYFSTF